MKLRISIVIIYLGLALAGCANIKPPRFARPFEFPFYNAGLPEDAVRRWEARWYNISYVSLIRLIATPWVFDRTPVEVTGVIATTEFGVLLFLDRESYKYFLTENAINILITDSHLDLEKLPEMEGKYVSVIGEFRDEHAGRYFINGQLHNVLPIKPGHILRPVIESGD